jgi:hypothetical protein
MPLTLPLTRFEARFDALLVGDAPYAPHNPQNAVRGGRSGFLLLAQARRPLIPRFLALQDAGREDTLRAQSFQERFQIAILWGATCFPAMRPPYLPFEILPQRIALAQDALE